MSHLKGTNPSRSRATDAMTTLAADAVFQVCTVRSGLAIRATFNVPKREDCEGALHRVVDPFLVPLHVIRRYSAVKPMHA